MIKANELRLGSWYNFANPMEGGVLHPEQFTAWNQYLDFEAYGEPIPLTPEILEKCGAKKNKKWIIKKTLNKLTLLTENQRMRR